MDLLGKFVLFEANRGKEVPRTKKPAGLAVQDRISCLDGPSVFIEVEKIRCFLGRRAINPLSRLINN